MVLTVGGGGSGVPQHPLESSIWVHLGTHSLALFAWAARDSFGSSGAWGSLNNKTEP